MTTKLDFTTCKLCGGPFRIRAQATTDGLTVAECRKCGLRFVKTIPESKLWSSDSEEDTAHYYEDQYQGVPEKFPYGLALIQKFLNKPTTGLTLLDVGCGRGDFLSMAQEAGFTVSGLEMSKGAIALCHKRGFTRIFEGDLSAPPGEFDVISLFDVAEHVEEPHPFFEALVGKLKPGGLLYIEVPRLSLLDVYLDALALFTPIRNNRVSREHVQIYSDEALKQLLTRHGFSILHYETRTSLSWQDKKPYIRNLGIRVEWLVSVIEQLANVALALGILGKNKALVVVQKPMGVSP